MMVCGSLISCSQRIVKVHDGDTYYTSTGKTIRLAEVDCPELGQAYGEEAKVYAESQLLNHKVTIEEIGVDKYGRTIAYVLIRGARLDSLLVSNGLAWAYKRYATIGLISLEMTAKKNHIGLWSQPHVPPFKFRNQQQ